MNFKHFLYIKLASHFSKRHIYLAHFQKTYYGILNSPILQFKLFCIHFFMIHQDSKESLRLILAVKGDHVILCIHENRIFQRPNSLHGSVLFFFSPSSGLCVCVRQWGHCQLLAKAEGGEEREPVGTEKMKTKHQIMLDMRWKEFLNQWTFQNHLWIINVLEYPSTNQSLDQTKRTHRWCLISHGDCLVSGKFCFHGCKESHALLQQL